MSGSVVIQHRHAETGPTLWQLRGSFSAAYSFAARDALKHRCLFLAGLVSKLSFFCEGSRRQRCPGAEKFRAMKFSQYSRDGRARLAHPAAGIDQNYCKRVTARSALSLSASPAIHWIPLGRDGQDRSRPSADLPCCVYSARRNALGDTPTMRLKATENWLELLKPQSRAIRVSVRFGSSIIFFACFVRCTSEYRCGVIPVDCLKARQKDVG